MTPATPFVSVIIPCHNREQTVAAATQSVLSQDYPDFEVIAVDDASSDGTLDVLKSLSHPDLKILSNPGPGGSGASRNHGWRHAKGEWIAFQDSDDLWLEGKLRKQMDLVMRDDQAVAVYCAMVIKPDASPDAPIIGRLPQPDIKTTAGNILPSLVLRSFISTQTVIIRRDVLERTGGFDIEMPALNDWELMLRVAQLGNVLFVNEDLVVQRFSDNSVTKKINTRVLAQTLLLEKNSDIISTVPGAIAYHHSRISGGYRNLGQYPKAQEHAAKALQATFTLRRLFTLLYVVFKKYTQKPTKD